MNEVNKLVLASWTANVDKGVKKGSKQMSYTLQPRFHADEGMT